MPDLPPDPFAGRDGFVGLNQTYLNLRGGGFTRFEALFFSLRALPLTCSSRSSRTRRRPEGKKGPRTHPRL